MARFTITIANPEKAVLFEKHMREEGLVISQGSWTPGRQEDVKGHFDLADVTVNTSLAK